MEIDPKSVKIATCLIRESNISISCYCVNEYDVIELDILKSTSVLFEVVIVRYLMNLSSHFQRAEGLEG